MALQEEFESQGSFLFRYRSHLPLLLLPAALGVFLYNGITTLVWYGEYYSLMYKLVCMFVSLLGMFVRLYTVGYTPNRTSGRNTKQQVAETLNTRGIYSLVRHPLYIGNFLLWLGIAMLTVNLWFVVAFVFIYWVYYERIMYAEEQFLRRKFGDVYVRWAEKTPAVLFSFKNWQASELNFSMRKIIRKEKNTFFALFTTFYLFRLVEILYLGGKPTFFEWEFIAMVASGIYYIVIRQLRRNTNLLAEVGR